MDFAQAVGNRVRQLRTTAGLTSSTLAKRAGLRSPQELTAVEDGRDIRLSTLAAVAGGLKVPLEQLTASLFQEPVEKLRKMKLGDLAQRLSKQQPQSAAPARAPSPDELAKMILAIPDGGSKLETVERAVVRHAMVVCDGNISAAARLLGIDRKAMERRWRRVRSER